jgi:hypothetical protein
VTIDLLPPFIRENYEVHEWRHACAVLSTDFPAEWRDICDVFSEFRLRHSHIAVPGGRKSKVAESIDRAFERRGWREKKFKTQIKVDDQMYDSPTHSVDCFKNRIGLEIEWNNKDPFYDRDLNNFRLLFDLRSLAVGVIVTRKDELQGLLDNIGRGGSYGQSSTHMSKLLPRLEGGSGGGCPILVLGISKTLYDANS